MKHPQFLGTFKKSELKVTTTNSEHRDYSSLGCVVFTASDTRTPSDDSSGDLIVAQLTEAGHNIVSRAIIREDLTVMRDAIRGALQQAEVDVLIITGGTGITRRDLTPEALSSFMTKEIPGFGELFRWLSYDQIGSSTIQSRAFACLCDQTLAFALPGSPRAVQLALDEILIPQLDINHKPCNFVQLMPRIRRS